MSYKSLFFGGTRTLQCILFRLKSTQAVNKFQYKSNIQHIEDDILFQEFNDKGLITLNRPTLNNCINNMMLEKIIKVLTHWEKTKKVVIIKGAGEKVFSAGGDVKALYKFLRTCDTLKDVQQFIHKVCELSYLIQTYKKPIVSLANGLSIGIGMTTLLQGKYIVATETTQCRLPEVQLGLGPGIGAPYLFQKKLKNNLGLYLCSTGRNLKGIDAKLSGIATHYVSSLKLPEITEALLAPGDIDVKEILDKFDEQDPHAELSWPKYSKQLEEYFSGDSVEDIIQRLKNNNSEWSQKILKTLHMVSPTSLKIAKRVLEKGKNLDLIESSKMEFTVAKNLMIKKSDFEEGVRAMIIDKDYKPNWNPPTLEQVTDEYIESKFIPSSDNQPTINFSR